MPRNYASHPSGRTGIPASVCFKVALIGIFKDHATGESGDEIKLLALHHKMDPRCDFISLVSIYSSHAGISVPTVHQFSSKPKKVPVKMKEPSLSIGSSEQLKRMAKSRPYQMEALKWASSRGVLRFMRFVGNECYAITDQSRKLVEYRRVDNKPFNAYKGLAGTEDTRHERQQQGLASGDPGEQALSIHCPSRGDTGFPHGPLHSPCGSRLPIVKRQMSGAPRWRCSVAVGELTRRHFHTSRARRSGSLSMQTRQGRRLTVRWREQIMPHAKEVNYLQV